MSKRLVRIAILALPTLIAAAILAYATLPDRQAAEGQSGRPVASSPQIGGPFTLVDDTGAAFDSQDLAGDYMLIFFGFTYCPDVCPTELSNIARVMDILGEDGGEVHPLFITIDPERDTPEAMADYVDLFHPRLTGLTGTPEQIAETASEFRVFYQRAESDRFEDYLMDHSTFTYLMGPEGENLAVFAYGTDPEEMAASIRSLMDETSA